MVTHDKMYILYNIIYRTAWDFSSERFSSPFQYKYWSWRGICIRQLRDNTARTSDGEAARCSFASSQYYFCLDSYVLLECEQIVWRLAVVALIYDNAKYDFVSRWNVLLDSGYQYQILLLRPSTCHSDIIVVFDAIYIYQALSRRHEINTSFSAHIRNQNFFLIAQISEHAKSISNAYIS